MSDVPPRRRPVTVTLAVAVVYVGGLLNTALGVLILLSRYQVAEADVLFVSLLGAALSLLGLLTIAGASSLARGSALARGLLTGYLVGLFALHIVAMLATDWDFLLVVQMAAEVAVVALVWTPPGFRYFRPATGTGPDITRAT